MTNRQVIPVSLSERSYPIEIGAGNLRQVGDFVRALRRVSHVVVITDEHVQPHAERVTESLASAETTVDLVVLEAGEASKSAEVAQELWQKLLELGAGRKTLIVAVGGGVIGDLSGFVAATFARGLAFIQVPTTLLAQVDSSVGGKVAINLPGAKNMVGAFWQPLGVLIDTTVLDSLPPREYRSGLAEVVKYGVILDAEFFAWLEANVEGLNSRRSETLRQTVARCCQLKAQVVSEDEREETGLRSVLNYGHTFCHAFETLTGYGSLLHGEGVAIGMMCASRLAERLGRIPAEVTRRQHDLLTALGLSVKVLDLDPNQVLAAMGRDKKSEHGTLRFVLPDRLGHVEIVTRVNPDDVRAALAG